MKIRNGELEQFINYLSTFHLSSTEGRMRNRFKKILLEKLQQYDLDRQDLVKQFSRKGENDEPLTKLDDSGVEVGDIEDVIGFNNEYIILLNEYAVIEENFSNELMLKTICNLVLNDKNEYFGLEADLWEQHCILVEQINYNEEGEQSHVGD